MYFRRYCHITFFRRCDNYEGEINKCKECYYVAIDGLLFILSIEEKIPSDDVTTIYTTVIAFYFGTQTEKKGEVSNGNYSELPNKK